jgi:hypothetical protein
MTRGAPTVRIRYAATRRSKNKSFMAMFQPRLLEMDKSRPRDSTEARQSYHRRCLPL